MLLKLSYSPKPKLNIPWRTSIMALYSRHQQYRCNHASHVSPDRSGKVTAMQLKYGTEFSISTQEYHTNEKVCLGVWHVPLLGLLIGSPLVETAKYTASPTAVATR